jgi:hypothetical protein
MITADQIVAHLIGDYLVQSDWMAREKICRLLPAAVHAFTYSLLFIFFRPSIAAWLVILITHFFIDRYRLARFVVWAKNFLAPAGSNPPWSQCSKTGYPDERPAFLTVWLTIICDNCIHVLINAFALKWL